VHFVAPNHRTQITPHRFKATRIMFVKPERTTIAKSHHDGQIEVLGKIMTNRWQRSPDLHPHHSGETLEIPRRLFKLFPILLAVRIF
jgi:hypothetical protein